METDVLSTAVTLFNGAPRGTPSTASQRKRAYRANSAREVRHLIFVRKGRIRLADEHRQPYRYGRDNKDRPHQEPALELTERLRLLVLGFHVNGTRGRPRFRRQARWTLRVHRSVLCTQIGFRLYGDAGSICARQTNRPASWRGIPLALCHRAVPSPISLLPYQAAHKDAGTARRRGTAPI